ncbi:MAG: hypothetical protein KA802_11755 [Saprospiraceae bacterium]|nr:hypothetical protein [Saprospiraceae bacterium]MBP8892708.1 hypothetical protein [Saprospiraceae bacterium]
MNPSNFPLSHHYPFGMLIPGRQWSAGSEYRYGFNGQEQDDEVYGNGNLNTAMFWEYDTRLGRRWNTDPITNESFGPYTSFNNNPIIMVDPYGNKPDGFTIDKGGNIERVDNTGGEKYDVLFEKAEYDKGNNNYDYEGTGNTGIRINDNLFIDKLRLGNQTTQIPYKGSKIEPVTYATIESSNAYSIYTFLADATAQSDNFHGWEWSFIRLKDGSKAIGTAKSSTHAIAWEQIEGFQDKTTHQKRSHSHPGKEFLDDFNPSGADKAVASDVRLFNPNATFILYMPLRTQENYNLSIKNAPDYEPINFDPGKEMPY